MNERDASWVAGIGARAREAVGAVVIGQEGAVRFSLLTLLCGGHALFEGVPGVAKTLLVRAIAATVGIRFGRIQATPDLMPSDIIGTPVFHPGDARFHFRPGPLFTDLLLFDEINRAPAKTQAALLEAMQERAATVDGVRHPLGDLFTVFATQNPIEQEGTYPLPEAELDRFLFKVAVAYPAADAEQRMLGVHHAADPPVEALERVLGPEELRAARDVVHRVVVRDEILGYVTALTRATREDPSIAVGASPRAGLWLVRAAKAIATLEGRDFVLPEDVQEAALPVFRHRVVLEPGAEVEGRSPDDVVGDVLRSIPVPH